MDVLAARPVLSVSLFVWKVCSPTVRATACALANRNFSLSARLIAASFGVATARGGRASGGSELATRASDSAGEGVGADTAAAEEAALVAGAAFFSSRKDMGQSEGLAGKDRGRRGQAVSRARGRWGARTGSEDNGRAGLCRVCQAVDVHRCA
jgi:hypothetical protein